jgi:hypothetical protein
LFILELPTALEALFISAALRYPSSTSLNPGSLKTGCLSMLAQLARHPLSMAALYLWMPRALCFRLSAFHILPSKAVLQEALIYTP